MKIEFDAKLQQLLLSGDKDAFTQTIEVCKGLVYASALGIVKNKHDAEDVTQDVFTLLYKKREGIKADANIPVWLYTSTIFISKKLLRHQKVKSSYKKEDGNTMSDEMDSSNELKDVVLEELLNLSLKYRDVLVRHYVLDEKYKDIAEHLGVNLSTVAMQIKRGLEKLKSNLSRKGYAVSTAMLLSIVMKPENAFAASSLDASHISSEIFKSADSFKVYRSGNDSQAFKSFSQSKKAAFLLKPYLFVLLVVGSVGAYVFSTFHYDEKPIVTKPIAQKEVMSDFFKPLIWNHDNGNLAELKALQPFSILKTKPKTNRQYISNTEKDSAYVFIPFDIPSKPIKVKFQVKHISNTSGNMGLSFVKDNIVMAHRQFRTANRALGSNKTYEIEYYFFNKASLFVAENKVIHFDYYLEDLNQARVMFNMQYLEVYEVKVEQMTKPELEMFEKVTDNRDKKGGVFFNVQRVPKFD